MTISILADVLAMLYIMLFIYLGVSSAKHFPPYRKRRKIIKNK